MLLHPKEYHKKEEENQLRKLVRVDLLDATF
jgi:hypothetical protein